MATKTEEQVKPTDGRTAVSKLPQKTGKGGWFEAAIQKYVENLTHNKNAKQDQMLAQPHTEVTNPIDQDANKREVRDYVEQRLKQLPIEEDEQVALNQVFWEVIGGPSGATRSKKIRKSVRPNESECKISKDLLEVSKLEHVEAMKRSFRQLSRLGTEEIDRLHKMQNINHVRATVFHLRQIQANRRSIVLRMQALKRRQTAMGNAHVRAFPSGLGASYTCYFCSISFPSVTDLHAHLLTQEHLCIRLPPGTTISTDQKRSSLSKVEAQTNNSNATELSVHDKQTPQTDSELRFLMEKLKGKKKSAHIKMMLSVYRCMYCGTFLYKGSISDHRCLREMSAFLEREIQYMNMNGSPFVCLLCDGSVYDTPARLQLHLAASHGADRGVTHCTLCEVEFRPPVMSRGDDAVRTMAAIYQRHLMAEHLPSLELTEKLLYISPHLVSWDIVSSAPVDDVAYRSYRCVFPHEQPAGKGAPFPYPHWANEDDHYVWTTSRQNGDTTKFTSSRVEPGFSREGQRPSKQRSDRTCLISPQLILQYLAARCPKLTPDDSVSKPKACPAGRQGNLRNLPFIIAHVICEHAGNPYSFPGARELILAQHAASRVRKKLGTVHDVIRLTDAWISAVENSEGGDDLEAFQQSVSKSTMRSKRPLYTSHSTMSDNKCNYVGHNLSNKNESHVGGKSTDSVTSPRNRSCCQLKGLFCQLESPLRHHSCAERSIKVSQYALTVSERFLWGNKGSVYRNQLLSHRISRSPTLTSFGRNKPNVPEEIRNKLRSAAQAQRVFCRACPNSAMPSWKALLTHIREDHLRTLEARMVQMQRSGTFSGLVDPTRTCFQCYTVLEDHFTFQIHNVVFHGSRYPLVCGLCRQPLVNMCMSEDIHPICNRMFEECGIKMTDEKWNLILHPHSEAQTFTSPKLAQKLIQTAEAPETVGIRAPTDDEIRATFEMEELVSIVSCIKASLSVLRYSPQLVMKAMEMHEYGHVSELRRRYLPATTIVSSNRRQTIMEMQQRALIQGVSQTMEDEFKNLQVRRGEEHERQLQLATIRLGMDAWDRLQYGSTFKQASKRKSNNASSKHGDAVLTDEVRTLFKNISIRTSTDD
ncbi:hypothetical protein D915_006081 [Fasciola hepatica]|uniref:C2H2-type domain-containing protein n=1 Tax=Fasciola hepatica TaxID=6192 RepID=A0A4E0R5G0_FASHE|nr:hypothetical protein D915_006081 [Fasciola hepatica]